MGNEQPRSQSPRIVTPARLLTRARKRANVVAERRAHRAVPTRTIEETRTNERARTALIAAAAGVVWIALAVVGTAKLLAPEPPLAGYGEVTEAEARDIGGRVAAGFSARDPSAFDEALDLEAFARLILEDAWTTSWQRVAFAAGLRQGMSQLPAGSIGGSIVESLEEGTRVKLLHSRVVDGARRALLRLTPAEGVNYFELVLARDPSGKPRVVDWYSYMTGELGHVTLRALTQATGPGTSSAARLFRRLVDREWAGEELPREPQKMGESIRRMRELIDAGDNEEALAAWKELPESIRTTRALLIMRLQAAQGLSESIYQEAIDDIDVRFPEDSSLALLKVDGYFLQHDWAGALGCLDEIEAAIGGDPFLATLRSVPLLEVGRGAEAKALLMAAMLQEDDLVELWWTAVGVSLRLEDHAETARLLDEIATKFSMGFNDLTTVPEYAGFVRSRQYRAWRARQAKSRAPADANAR